MLEGYNLNLGIPYRSKAADHVGLGERQNEQIRFELGQHPENAGNSAQHLLVIDGLSFEQIDDPIFTQLLVEAFANPSTISNQRTDHQISAFKKAVLDKCGKAQLCSPVSKTIK